MSRKNIIAYFFALLVAAIAAGCGGGDGRTADSGATDGDISMLTPYKNSSDMASINGAFSSAAGAASSPWGFAHDGIDFTPNGRLKPFQAVSSGVVEYVQLMQNNISLNWQVNVRIKYNSTYSVEYAFEPFSPDQSDGNIQLDNILVSVGQNVAQGYIIGYLYTVYCRRRSACPFWFIQERCCNLP